ncbi:TIGR01244 family sulfur transferase [Marivivens sp. LCG002]|uniref:TIGR01244 family sulfur transferase n=1 Tax=Marivivens sp. LCG002 TaxID=3051171 RepID=UPI0025576C87|nr:TIGR01244 family sulfur transferase [Marivivens sp. LCG002]WIV49640.1 TIGR01244 family sulfur transferase [Marivivens sp. LCG002]
MDIRNIASNYSVSPQILPTDVAAIKAAGFTTVLCNRPDEEVPSDIGSDAMRKEVEAAGLRFVFNPVTHQSLNAEMVKVQMSTIEQSSGPVLAYCASGTRSSIVWSLGSAKSMPVDAIIEATARAGYDLQGLRQRITDLAAS